MDFFKKSLAVFLSTLREGEIEVGANSLVRCREMLSSTQLSLLFTLKNRTRVAVQEKGAGLCGWNHTLTE